MKKKSKKTGNAAGTAVQMLAGLVTGGVMVFVWKFGIAKLGGAFAIYELLPAFLCGLAAIVIVSLATPAPDKAIVDVFDEINEK